MSAGRRYGQTGTWGIFFGLWQAVFPMTRDQINEKWKAYKVKYQVDSPVLIEEVRYDAPRGVESSFDVTEMFSERYILHLSENPGAACTGRRRCPVAARGGLFLHGCPEVRWPHDKTA